MRKFGALSLATFYLLLTTGVFVCLVHCSAEYLFVSPKISLHEHDGNYQAHEKNEAKHHHKPCGKDKDCACCNHHGTYVITENLNNPDFVLSIIQIAVSPVSFQQLSLTPIISERLIEWPDATGPPDKSTPPIYIANRSLLI